MFRFAQHDTSYLSMPGWAEWNSPHSGNQQRFFFLELACVAEIEPATVAAMKTSTKIFAVAGALVLTLAFGIGAASPEQEKAFTDKYKAALEGKDTATLESFFTHEAQTPGPLSFTK